MSATLSDVRNKAAAIRTHESAGYFGLGKAIEWKMLDISGPLGVRRCCLITRQLSSGKRELIARLCRDDRPVVWGCWRFAVVPGAKELQVQVGLRTIWEDPADLKAYWPVCTLN